ncbi:DUF6933 domain-containing protein [Silvanigrella aquatica]|uniref:DUF6933 domain-containing protein n=1 Tax=Silvanigrella aquatica TaxID=1915309 RepID=A0A1L4CXX4_9BACT|nr:hypothetical protein [Silvanigrella aquatica]APJ02796.1 hypothetical protein AXG55_02190 [Silvanigrella aquatica]
MVQIRLTKKFSSDLKIKNIPLPKAIHSIYDNWIIDNLVLNRKKIAMATHLEPRLTFFFPYTLIGGAKNIVAFIEEKIKNFILKNNLKIDLNKINIIFKYIYYCKNTDNKSVVSNMTDLKKIFLAHVYGHQFDKLNWQELNDITNDSIISFKSSEEKYVSPRERMIKLIKSL